MGICEVCELNAQLGCQQKMLYTQQERCMCAYTVCEQTEAARAGQVVCCLPEASYSFPFMCWVCPQVQTYLCTEVVRSVLVVRANSVPLVTVHVLNPLLLYPQEVSQIALPCSLKYRTHGSGVLLRQPSLPAWKPYCRHLIRYGLGEFWNQFVSCKSYFLLFWLYLLSLLI